MRNCLRGASTEALDVLVERLNTIRATYLPPSRFIVGLEEAQRAARLYRYSFISSTNGKVLRSILREIVEVFTKLPIKLVVSGTSLSLEELEEAMPSGVSKPAEAVILFHELDVRYLAETEAVPRTLRPCFLFGITFWLSPATTDPGISSGSVSQTLSF
jgi:hypothetical protein